MAVPVYAIMSRRLLVASPLDSVMYAVARMRQAGVRHLLVCEFGRLLGIVSEKDIPARVNQQLLVADIMTTNPICIQAQASSEHAAEIMRKAAIASLPVVNGSELVGIVTVSDLMKTRP